MTCQNLGVLCLQWLLVMASIVIGTLSADTKPRLVPPTIIDGPNIHEYFVISNDRKDLPCTAAGTPPIVYKWLFNGAEVLPGDKVKISEGSLHINNPSVDMEGYYQCLASNEAGVAISNITFLQAAVFKSLPARERNIVSKLSVKEWDNVVLNCSHVTRSVPPALVSWEMSPDGDEYNFRPVQLGEEISQTANGSLVFSFVRKNNSAMYKCEPQNRITRESSGGSKCNLTIESGDSSIVETKLNEPPILLYASPDVTLLEGTELRLQCIFGAWPPHEVEWTTPSGVTNVSHALVIPRVIATDAGVYSCRARKMSARNSPLLSEPFNISVQVDAIPEFATPLSNQEVPDSGRDATFTCQGWGRPSPLVTWYINGTSADKLEDANDHSISGNGPTSVLVLTNIRTSATVTCNISNAHGYRLQSAVVTVYDPTRDAENIPTSSSHSVIITSLMTPADKQPSTKTYEMTTKPYQPYQLSTTSYHSSTTVSPTKNVDDEQNKDNTNTNDTPAPHVVVNSLSSTTTTIIIAASVVVVVVLVVIVVVVVIIVRKRRRRGSFSLTEQGRPLRLEPRIINEHIYDSDDSGFDDPKTENERRALQGQQPSS